MEILCSVLLAESNTSSQEILCSAAEKRVQYQNMDLEDLPRELKHFRRRLHISDPNSEEFADLIRTLWKTTSFAGAFGGVSNFRHALQYEMDVDVSIRKIRKILSGIKTFSTFMRLSKNYATRHYHIHGSFMLWQADIVNMWRDDDYKFILLVVDCFSLKTFAKKLKTKQSEEVREAFKEIFKNAGGIPEKLQTDQVKLHISSNRKRKHLLKLLNFFRR